MLTIIGIDPGTTLGLTALDLSGNIIEIKNYRNQSINKIINKIISIGTPIAVCTDKKETPKYIQEVSSKLGINTINPNQDLTIKEKNAINRIYENSSNNSHERDSLAAAFTGYLKLKPLIDKVKKKTDETLFEEVLLKTIKEEKSIYHSIEETKTKKEPPNNNKTKNKKSSNLENESKIQELSERISELKQELRKARYESFLKEEIIKKKDNQLKNLKENFNSRLNEKTEQKNNDLLRIISKEQETIEELKKNFEETKNRLNALEKTLSPDVLIIKRIHLLKSKDDLKEEYIFIDTWSKDKKLLEEIDLRKTVVLTKNKELDEFVFITGEDIEYISDEYVIIKKDKLENALKEKKQSKSNIFKIISDYKTSRKD